MSIGVKNAGGGGGVNIQNGVERLCMVKPDAEVQKNSFVAYEMVKTNPQISPFKIYPCMDKAELSDGKFLLIYMSSTTNNNNNTPIYARIITETNSGVLVGEQTLIGNAKNTRMISVDKIDNNRAIVSFGSTLKCVIVSVDDENVISVGEIASIDATSDAAYTGIISSIVVHDSTTAVIAYSYSSSNKLAIAVVKFSDMSIISSFHAVVVDTAYYAEAIVAFKDDDTLFVISANSASVSTPFLVCMPVVISNNSVSVGTKVFLSRYSGANSINRCKMQIYKTSTYFALFYPYKYGSTDIRVALMTLLIQDGTVSAVQSTYLFSQVSNSAQGFDTDIDSDDRLIVACKHQDTNILSIGYIDILNSGGIDIQPDWDNSFGAGNTGGVVQAAVLKFKYYENFYYTDGNVITREYTRLNSVRTTEPGESIYGVATQSGNGNQVIKIVTNE